MTESILSPVQLAPQAGRSFLVGHDLFTFKVTVDDTGGAYTLFVARIAPGGGAPPHIHHLEDIALLVLEGTFAITVAESTVRFGTGGFVFVPRGTILACENVGESPARLLFVVTPGGLQEQYFAEFGQPVIEPKGDLPAAPANVARRRAVAEQYGIEFVRPTIGT